MTLRSGWWTALVPLLGSPALAVAQGQQQTRHGGRGHQPGMNGGTGYGNQGGVSNTGGAASRGGAGTGVNQ